MGMIPILLAALAATAPSPMQDLVDCMERSAVELGADNNFTIDAVMKAAEAQCQPEWRRMRLTWEGNALVDDLTGKSAIDEEREGRELIYLAVFRKLATARSGRQ